MADAPRPSEDTIRSTARPAQALSAESARLRGPRSCHVFRGRATCRGAPATGIEAAADIARMHNKIGDSILVERRVTIDIFKESGNVLCGQEREPLGQQFLAFRFPYGALLAATPSKEKLTTGCSVKTVFSPLRYRALSACNQRKSEYWRRMGPRFRRHGASRSAPGGRNSYPMSGCGRQKCRSSRRG